MQAHHLSRAISIAFIALFIAVVAVGFSVARAFADDQATYDIIPNNTYIAGVDVSGMTAEQATEAVEATSSQQAGNIAMTLTASDTGETYPLSLAGEVTVDVDSAVEQAVELNHQRSALSRLIDGNDSETDNPRTDIELTYTIDTATVSAQVQALADQINVAATDASRIFNDDGTVTIVPESYGRTVDVDTTVAAVESTLAQASQDNSLADLTTMQLSAPLTVNQTAPSITTDSLADCVVVDYSQFLLTVYDNTGTAIWSCYIGYGRGWEDGVNYSSPEGLHYIEYFDPAPTWSNPDPDGWGADYKDYYAAGDPENPMGSREMKISDAPMVFIHGVHDPNCIGNRLSHGCINVWDDQVIELYELLYENAVAHDSSSVGGSGEPIYVNFINYPG